MACEGAGKRRIFAIGNYTKQRLLYPYHEWAMAVLRRIPNDGTFDQTAPLKRLVGFKNVFSFDLKSATDRFPLHFIYRVFECLFGPSLASAVVNSTLGINLFDLRARCPSRSISFVVGQPLGYYSSWALFSLSHHVLVWYCAELAYPGKRFSNYAILGDDVVIGDPVVARHYEESLSKLEVPISYLKSLISDVGAFEFAKRFRVREGRKDISPISFRTLCGAGHPFGLMAIQEKYPCRRFSSLLRIGGLVYSPIPPYPGENGYGSR
ncbi:uncharacterized mitochondrial protein AtMg01410 [Macadamia integrifolia]|uniref:uncharacterized mitochondrial protein AtMg01410 n=1 Tax=Macadamia integrifolia TaxID=60698 RepID=UPI001C5012C1|nr:uncharacterized mitochondrial protein AtMg01410 [Macadamia integrifolia]